MTIHTVKSVEGKMITNTSNYSSAVINAITELHKYSYYIYNTYYILYVYNILYLYWYRYFATFSLHQVRYPPCSGGILGVSH